MVAKEVGEYVVQEYVKMRKESHRNEGSTKKFSHVTPRSLLAILRLAQASARLRFDNQVRLDDVDEAIRLIEVSKSSYKEKKLKMKVQPPRSTTLSNQLSPKMVVIELH